FLLRDDLFIIPSLKSCLRNQLTSNFITRKVGNSLVVTIPQSLNVAAGEKFSLQASDDGTMLLYRRDKSNNPWFNGEFANVDFDRLIDEVGDLGEINSLPEEHVEW
ncbi:AbrB/MazE/SpoVT family DNA-binding domain-containing protein, partial [Loigolactobacillus binensis]